MKNNGNRSSVTQLADTVLWLCVHLLHDRMMDPMMAFLKELVYLRNDRHKSGENCLQIEAGTFCLSAINSKLHQSYPHPPACSCCNSHFWRNVGDNLGSITHFDYESGHKSVIPILNIFAVLLS